MERTPGVHVASRIFICRPEIYFASDIHLEGVTLSVYTSLYVQCYFNKAKQNQNKQTKETKRGKRNKQKKNSAKSNSVKKYFNMTI